MSELLRTLKQLRINTKQSADPDYSNEAQVVLTLPRRRMNINVTRNLQDSSNEGYSSQARTTRSGRKVYQET